MMQIIVDPKVDDKFATYPEEVLIKMNFLRQLVIETASDSDWINRLEVTLKWNEPSFITNCGSTLRMDWKEKNPEQYAMYFQCTSRLVDTFKMIFGPKFMYEGNRALLFEMDSEIPVDELKSCIMACLTYHKVKHLATLGI
ncbi:DUF1801 domain-containing protein [Euzebyella marina]|uniref:DUF1801 domain-containing protein n=1 Tax=Euzebyella marina TaxID=1761453 RepID=A0A3G2L6V1_9FLAO|nr:DUF1801 domain-containing protein [Euzebyella marina]AYN67975.1 DUF1801 domain-containing protein [Euzebyella marina]